MTIFHFGIPAPVKADPNKSAAEKFWIRVYRFLFRLRLFSLSFYPDFHNDWPLLPEVIQPINQSTREDGVDFICFRGLKFRWLFLTFYFIVRCPMEKLKSSEELMAERERAARAAEMAERIRSGETGEGEDE